MPFSAADRRFSSSGTPAAAGNRERENTLNGEATGQQPQPFQIMAKPRGPVCNLDCAYCYYLSKERLYSDSDFRMSDELLAEYTRQYLESQAGLPEVTFAWQGGEPLLMGLDFFRRALELQREYAPAGVRVVNALQTNGTLLDAEWCRFFAEHDFLIGISIDGPRELHDEYRRDRAGQGSFDRVMAGLAWLQEYGVEHNALTCVHAANAPHPLEVYSFLRDEAEVEFVQFIPIVERENETGYQEGETITDRSVTGKQYGEFLIAVFDDWVRRDVGRIFVQIFDVALAAFFGRRPGLCVFEETCGTALVLEHSGDLYSCDHFVEPAHHLGNIADTPLADMARSERQRSFGAAKRDALPPTCRECAVYFVCHGGCPKNRVLTTPEGEPGLNWLCEGYRAFFTHIEPAMRFMAGELRAGRPPANIMYQLPGANF